MHNLALHDRMFTDPRLRRVSPEARYLLLPLLASADVCGRMVRDDALFAQCYPPGCVPDVAPLLAELVAAGFLSCGWSQDGRRLIEITDFGLWLQPREAAVPLPPIATVEG